MTWMPHLSAFVRRERRRTSVQNLCAVRRVLTCVGKLREPMKERRVLVVEDDPETLATIRDLFRRAGYTVDTASDGREALARLLDGDMPSAVVLDARLPVMSGREFVSVVRAYSRLASVPIVLLTAWDAPDSFAKSVDAVMRKPFRSDELVATVEALIVRNPSAAAG